MITILTQLTGGIGLFLLGMALMTDSLKAMAGDSLRLWLGRFTGSPIKAMFSGIGFTMLVQSSTATTLTTISFVSAGVLTFVQAIGVIIGANIGTTSTGWLVAFLGLKFSITAFALPMIGVGAMMKILGKEMIAYVGLSLAGFGLLFLGIDFLQLAMADFAKAVDLTQWSDNSIGTQLILILVGLIMTVLLQSSTAAVTATLAALASGAIDLPQALSLVIGQNIGTVATAVLAAIGASISARRTAAVHVVFNVVSAGLALFFLAPFTLYLVKNVLLDVEHTVIIAGFHTAFSLLGALLFMPFTAQFQKAIETLIPQKDISHTRFLDESLFSLPSLAINAGKLALCQSLSDIYKQIIQAGKGEILGKDIGSTALDDTLTQVDNYLKKMPVPTAKNDQQNLSDLLRLVVYARVIRDDILAVNLIDELRGDSEFLPQALVYFEQLTHYLAHLPIEGIDKTFVETFVAFGDEMKAQKYDLRFSVVQHTSHASEALDQITALRWLDHLVKHTAKMVMLLKEKTPQNQT